MGLVLDASAAVRAVMRTDEAGQLIDLLSDEALVLAPSLYSCEVANALWKYVQAGVLRLELALERLDEAANLIDEVTPDSKLTTEALAEAARYKHPVYDLLYAVLARRHGYGVLTMDRRLSALLKKMGIPAIEP